MADLDAAERETLLRQCRKVCKTVYGFRVTNFAETV